MNSKTARALMVAALVAAIVAGAAWYLIRVQLREARMDELAPIVALLKEDQALLQALQADSSDSGVLASYLARIRADGVAKHAEMKQRLDRLAENNAGILALIRGYSPHAKSETFKAEADKFSHYAIAWRDRWNSVMELFMAGGNYPVAEVPFPKEFLAEVVAEMEAVHHAL